MSKLYFVIFRCESDSRITSVCPSINQEAKTTLSFHLISFPPTIYQITHCHTHHHKLHHNHPNRHNQLLISRPLSFLTCSPRILGITHEKLFGIFVVLLLLYNLDIFSSLIIKSLKLCLFKWILDVTDTALFSISALIPHFSVLVCAMVLSIA